MEKAAPGAAARRTPVARMWTEVLLARRLVGEYLKVDDTGQAISK